MPDAWLQSVNPVRADGWAGLAQVGGTQGDGSDPSQPDPLYWLMSQRWDPCFACVEGTQYLRANPQTYLPQAPMELPEAWRGRVARSVFSPFFSKLVRVCTGLILRKPIRIEGDAFWEEEFVLDVDRQGTPLDEFVRDQLSAAISFGHSSFLVDFPDTSNIRTLKDQNEAGLRPYFVPVPIRQVIGWRSDPRVANGKLQQVRIREVAQVAKGRFLQEVKNRVRVIERGQSGNCSYELYEAKGERGNTGWEVIESGRMSVKDIPLVTVYGQKEATLLSRPPLEAIAHLNLAHYARRADLIQCLFVAAQPLLVLRGFDDQQDPVGLSCNNALLLPPEGGAEYVEPASNAFQAQRDELDALVEEMKSLGLAIMNTTKPSQVESGVAKALDRTDSNAVLSVISKSLEQGLQQAFDIAAAYMGMEPPVIGIDRDFDVQELDGAGISAINTIFTSGLIDQETALKLLHKGEVLSDETDIEAVIAAAEVEQAAAMEHDLAMAEGQAKIAAQHAPPKPAPPKG